MSLPRQTSTRDDVSHVPEISNVVSLPRQSDARSAEDVYDIGALQNAVGHLERRVTATLIDIN